jgi:hypothetical protein
LLFASGLAVPISLVFVAGVIAIIVVFGRRGHD